MQKILLLILCFSQSVYATTNTSDNISESNKLQNTNVSLANKLKEIGNSSLNKQEQTNIFENSELTNTTNKIGNESPILKSISLEDTSPSSSSDFSVQFQVQNQEKFLQLKRLYQTDNEGNFIDNSEEACLGRNAFDMSRENGWF